MTDFPQPLHHGPLTEVDDDIYSVSGTFRMAPGANIGRTMTLIVSGGSVTVLNAIRLSDTGQAEIDALGEVRHLVKLSDSHGVDEPFYVDRYKPTFWSLPGADLSNLDKVDKVKTDGLEQRTLGPDGPIESAVVVDYPNTQGWRESAYWVPTGDRTLVTCDAIQNCQDVEETNFLGGVMSSLMGFKGGVIVPPMWRRFQKLKGPAVSETLAGLATLSFENLITGHGQPILGGADQLVRSAIERAAG